MKGVTTNRSTSAFWVWNTTEAQRTRVSRIIVLTTRCTSSRGTSGIGGRSSCDMLVSLSLDQLVEDGLTQLRIRAVVDLVRLQVDAAALQPGAQAHIVARVCIQPVFERLAGVIAAGVGHHRLSRHR